MKYCLLLVTVLFNLCSHAQEKKLWKPWYITPRTGPQHVDLNGDWTLSFRDDQIVSPAQLAGAETFKTSIPSSVHWSLYNAGKLPHPYYNKNSDLYKWVDEKVWYYTKTVSLPATLPGNLVYLCFDGLDYFSKVWINDTLLGVHEGMFGGPSVEVSRYIRYGKENKIIVELRAGNWGNKAVDFDKLPRTATGDRDFTGRKGYNSRASGRIIKPWVISGGSGAEMFFSIGMWQPVRLEVVPPVHLERPFIVTRSVEKGKASLHLSAEILADTDGLDQQLHPIINTGLWHPKHEGNTYMSVNGNYALRVEFYHKGKKAFTQQIALDLLKGRNWVEKNFELTDPKIWNPSGLGNPDLYEVRCVLLQNGKAADEIRFEYGIRTIERIASAGPRMSDRWENWQFVVNGKKIFVKGMNFTPQDVLLETDAVKYRWTLTAAKNMGVQMIRVWGGGLLETDAFYKICNELGLMVWQDFPIGNQNTPDYPQDIWQAQVVQNICRLRNHPSLVVWCGGNEFNPYTEGNTATIGILERNLKTFDNSRLFLRASPDAGSVHMYPDMDPSWYNKSYKFEPWVAETGMHSMPEANLLREVVATDELKEPGRMWEKDFSDKYPDFVHHFAEYGPARVPRMLSRASHITDVSTATIDQLSEATQVGSAEFYQILSEKVQSNYPVTTGLMPWVFKRQWPTIAIQFMDWFGHANIPYYFLKRTYEPLHVTMDLPRLFWAAGERVPLGINVINALQHPETGHVVSVKVYDDGFKEQWQKKIPVSIKSGASVTKKSVGEFMIPTDYKNRFLFVIAELHDKNGRLISRSVYQPRSLVKMEDAAFYNSYLKAPVPWITLDKGPWLRPAVEKNTTALKLGTPVEKKTATSQSTISVNVSNTGNFPAFMTSLDITGAKRAIVASDNYYWLAPGETKQITLNVLWRSDSRNAKLVLQSWNAASKEIKL